MAKKQKTKKTYSTSAKSSVRKREKGSKLKRRLTTVLIIVVIALTLVVLMMSAGDNISLPENALGSILSPVQRAVSNATRGVKGFFTRWRNYDSLQADYEELEMENTQLQLELDSMEETTQENNRLRALLDAQDTYSSLDPIYAKVIARDAGPWFETFSINRGTSNGIAVGMAVVNADGLIGRVYEAGLNYAKVITIIDSRSAVACLVQRTRDNGIMRGQISASDSTAECYVYYLPNINSITPGDTVVTSGTDSAYPKGLKIGTVSAVSLDSGSEGTYAIISPSVDFQRIEEVFVLRTVIETDTDNLPTVVQVTAAPTATPTVNPNIAATPAPDATEDNQYWTRPTVQPTAGSYTNYTVNDLIEDTWANN